MADKSDGGKSYLVPSAILLGALALMFGPPSSTPSGGGKPTTGTTAGSPVTTGPAARPTATDPGPPGPWQPLRAFDPRVEDHPDGYPEVPGYAIETLIATLPDPVDSRFGYRFDMVLDAVQKGVESQGYVLDRFWLPWKPPSPGPQADPSQQEKFFEAVRARWAPKEPDRSRETTPGVVLYRHAVEPKLLLLFLVGETPTWGLHKGAMEASLDACRALALRGRPGRVPWIRVVGPYFSGTATSLAIAINTWSVREFLQFHVDPIAVQVLTGSATLVNRSRFLEDCGPVARVEFAATIHDDPTTLEELAKYLMRPEAAGRPTAAGRAAGGAPRLRRVALLSEEDTAFGSRRGPDQKSGFLNDAINIKFPLHISDVRSVYARGGPSPSSSIPKLVTPIDELPIPLDEGRGTLDLVPSQTPEMTAPTDNLILSKILNTLSRERFQYVGIVASDTRDKIFLIKLIRDYCPDVQIFFSQGDLLVSNPEFTRYLRGALVGSTYPLYSASQTWSYPYRGLHQRLLFAHEADEGVYNATLALLGDKRLIDYGMPLEYLGTAIENAEQLRTTPVPRTVPPIWISMIGQQGLWPVQAIAGKVDDPYLYAVDKGKIRPEVDGDLATGAFRRQLQRQGRPRNTMIWMVSFFALSFGSLATCLAGLALLVPLRAYQAVGGPLSRFRWVVRPAPSPIDRLWQKLYGVAWFATLLVAHRYLSLPAQIQPWPAPGSVATAAFSVVAAMKVVAASTLVAVALMLALFAVSAVVGAAEAVVRSRPALGARLMRRAFAGGWTGRIALFVLAAATAAAIGLVAAGLDALARRAALYFDSGLTRHPEWIFWMERTINPTNGLSPAPMALFLALGLGLWYQYGLRRVALRHWATVASPFPDAVVGTVDALTPLRRQAAPWWSPRRGFTDLFGIGLALVIALPPAFMYILFLWMRMLPTVEGPRFDRLVQIGFLFLVAAIVLALVQFVGLWRRIIRLGRDLVMLPLAPAFDRLPAKAVARFGKYLSGLGPDPFKLVMPVRQWALLSRTTDDEWRAIRAHFRQAGCPDEALDRLKALLGAEGIWSRFNAEFGAGHWPERTYDGPTQHRLSQATRACLRVLVPLWARLEFARAYPDRGPRGEAKPADDGGDPVATWIRRAEDFVAYEIVTWYSQFTTHAWSLGLFLAAAPFLLVVAVMSYPFEPQRLLALFTWALLLASLGVTFYTLVQLERDEFMSRVTKTPTQVDLSFIGTVTPYLVPLIGLVATQFPEVTDLLASYFGPISRVLH